jgi:hypothetical protein
VFTLDQQSNLTLTEAINATIYRFSNYTDSSGNVFEIGNEDDGGYIAVRDSQSHQEGGICINEFNPQMYTKNTYDTTPYRTLIEIHNDGAYLSYE